MVASVNLDLLPLKRVLAIEEAGTEHLPPERTPEEKSRFLLQRIDFEQSEEKDAKKAKSNKEAISQSTLKWPWQGLVENLQLAHQELSYILDFLTHVEGNEAITVANMVKPKQLLHEACSELALRAAVKLHNFKKVGKYLKQTAKALEQQVDREAVFYGALMRLQQHWKVKRLRGISAGPGGNAGFTIDLSYPQMSAEMMSGLSIRSAGLYSVNVEQDSSGLLMADLPGHCINTLHMRFSGPYTPHNGLKDELAKEDSTVLSSHEMKSELENKCTEKKARVTTEKDVGEAVNTGANAAHSVLRRIQTAIIDEQIFEWTVREALQPSSGLVVTGIEESSLQISLGHSCALVLELSKAMEGNPDTQNTDPKIAEIDGHGARKFKVEAQGLESNHDEINSAECNPKAEHRSPQSKGACTNFRKDMSAFVCLQQAFYYSAFVHPQELESSSYPAPKPGQMKSVDGASLLSKPRDSGAGVWQDSLVVEAVGPLKHFSLTMRHRVFSSRVLSELEKLVRGVPYLFLSFHPTWSSRVTTWELRLEIPQPIVEGWKMSMVSWREAQKKTRSKFYLKVILCDALLFVEGLEAMHMQEGASLEEWKRSKHRCDLTELSGFLLYQLAGQLVKWLYEEALVMGLKVRRNLLSIFFHISSKDDYVVLASLDIQAYCINWWLQLLGPEGEDKQELASSKSHSRRFLGPLNLETLRGVLVDLLNSCSDDLEKIVF